MNWQWGGKRRESLVRAKKACCLMVWMIQSFAMALSLNNQFKMAAAFTWTLQNYKLCESNQNPYRNSVCQI